MHRVVLLVFLFLLGLQLPVSRTAAQAATPDALRAAPANQHSVRLGVQRLDPLDHSWLMSALVGVLVIGGWTWILRRRVRRATEDLRRTNAMLESEIERRRKAQAESQLQQSYFQQLFASSPQAMACCDAEANVRFVNEAFEELFGFVDDEVAGKRLVDFIVPAPLRDEALRMSKELGAGHIFQRETVRLRKDGSRADVLLMNFPILIEGEFHGAYRVYVDISQQKRTQAELTHQAFHDKLTGLPNRALLMERLARALERKRRTPDFLFAVLFLDLDRFKTVNDSLGHLAGDELIQVTGDRIRSCVRSIDTVARIGGDEFAVVLENMQDPEEAEEVARRILEGIRRPARVRGLDLHSTASVGIVHGSGDYMRTELVLRDADIAMYRAKEEGKDRIMVFDAGMRERAVGAMRLENELRAGIEQGEFVCHYQPIADLATGRLVGFEALLRWNHPVQGLVGPADFVHVAEETGLIVDIGMAALTAACTDLHGWIDRHPQCAELYMSVNLSARQFLQPNLSGEICRAAAEAGLDMCSLQLEITESVIMDNAVATLGVLERLRESGARLAIDDFGTGYSSLSYLHRFPVDTIKIDRAFVARMDEVEQHEIVRAIILLAHALGMKAVAEGVEEESQLAALQAMDCDAMQGFLFARPMPAEQAEALLAEGACLDFGLELGAGGIEVGTEKE